MASLNSWLSPAVMRALGWALIHSLWQCLAIAALAALVMAFSRRPPLRYTIAVGALGVMLAAPIITFLLLVKPSAGHSFAFPRLFTALPPSPDILAWLVAAWLAGVAFFSLRFAGGFLLLEHRRRNTAFAPEARILALCRELQDQLGITRTIRYLECGWLQVPAVIGWLRPVMLLPACALTGLSEAQLRAVIAHELAHIRRLDCLVNLFQILTETLLFYHPATWWLNKRIRAERELCCDEIALTVCGDRLAYAKALTLMAEWEAAPALAMAANRGPLVPRILHLLGRKPHGLGQRMIVQSASLLFLLAALACAHALLGINYPIPKAQARQTIQAALTAGNKAVDQMRQAIEAITPPPPRIEQLAPRHRPVKLVTMAQPDLDMPAPPSIEEPQEIAATANGPANPNIAVMALSEAAESITVTATPLPRRPAVDEFVYSYPAQNRATEKMARWLRPICPTVMGLPSRFGTFVTQRLKAIALKAGAPVDGDANCRSNIQIVFTSHPQDIGDHLRKNHAPFLGWFDNLHQADELAKVRHDIQAWYMTATMGGSDGLHLDNPRGDFLTGGSPAGDFLTGGSPGGDILAVSSVPGETFPLPYMPGGGGSRLGNSIGTTLYNVIIVADLSKLGGYEMGPLADHIAVLALSQAKNFDACWEVPSITNLLAKNCDSARKTASLSDNDAAFLYGLYKMNAGSMIWAQRSQIRYFLERHAEPR